MRRYLPVLIGFLLCVLVIRTVMVAWSYRQQTDSLNYQLRLSHAHEASLSATLATLTASSSALVASLSAAVQDLKNQDQYKINQQQQDELQQINRTYTKSTELYARLIELIKVKAKTEEIEKLYALSLSQLAKRQYASATATLGEVEKKIQEQEAGLASGFRIPANVIADTKPPASGYRRQQVTIDIGTYLLDIITGDLNSTRVIVDTASDSDCKDNCPVLPLGDYVTRSGGYAGVNGSYFCPASYPSCAGKSNSFDTLVMNRNKHYLNSDNNVYSNVPAVIFSGTSARFVGRSLEWGRDTGVDAVLANQPLLVSGGKSVFGGNDDPKQGSKGSRSFVAATGSSAYIGVVHNVTVAEMARVLAGMGIDNALNLDSGGSTALWFQGYKVGPGRNIPNAIVFVRK